jgi:heme/copper-type cytochrome/quinol oxidase subunit 2
MSALGEGFIGILTAALASAILATVLYALTGYQAAYIHSVEKATTLTAGVEVNGTWVIEVAWTYRPVVRGFILANGTFIGVNSPVVKLIQCGVGYTPAPYRYCIFQVNEPIQPIEVVG